MQREQLPRLWSCWVTLSHSIRFSGLPPLWPQQLGVVIFFVLSGFLIAQTLRRRLAEKTSTFRDFFIDRWSRIYSGFLPALFLIAAIDYWAINRLTAHPETVSRFSVSSFFANLFMLQAPSVTLPFGSGGPLWTVAIEFWIYLFVGLFAFMLRDGLNCPKILLIAAVGAIPLQSLTTNNLVMIPWLMGAAAASVMNSSALKRLPAEAIGALVVGPAAIIGFHLITGGYVYTVLVFSLVTVAFLAAVEWSRRSVTLSRIPQLPSVISWWASWSYSLYLLHHTILLTFGFWPGITLSIVGSIIFAMLTEWHHKRLAQLIKTAINYFAESRSLRAFLDPPSRPTPEQN
jgi:peptidoglycan/LPS O-acetylase OafA/YrhL